jgi:hypothetical protein
MARKSEPRNPKFDPVPERGVHAPSPAANFCSAVKTLISESAVKGSWSCEFPDAPNRPRPRSTRPRLCHHQCSIIDSPPAAYSQASPPSTPALQHPRTPGSQLPAPSSRLPASRAASLSRVGHGLARVCSRVGCEKRPVFIELSRCHGSGPPGDHIVLVPVSTTTTRTI